MPQANDFTVDQASNGFTLSIRCQEISIVYEHDLTDADIEMWDRIAKVLNDNSAVILGDVVEDD